MTMLKKTKTIDVIGAAQAAPSVLAVDRHGGGGLFRQLHREFRGVRRRQRYTQAALAGDFRLTEQTQLVVPAQRVFQSAEAHIGAGELWQEHRRSGRAELADSADRQTEKRAHVQGELRQIL